jgi:predicted nucleic acid-binding protein
MVILHTSILAELMRPSSHAGMEAWLGRQPASSVFITTISEAELRHRVMLLAPNRRAGLLAAIGSMVSEDFAGRVLSFDSPAAAAYSEIAAARRENPIGVLDAQIAAIARSRGAALAARDPSAFEGCGIEVVDPSVRKS